MSKTRLTLASLATSVALAGCATGNYVTGGNTSDYFETSTADSRVNKGSDTAPTLNYTSPTNRKGFGVQRFSSAKNTSWEMAFLVAYGEPYEIVDADKNLDNGFDGLRPLRAANIHLTNKTLEEGIEQNTVGVEGGLLYSQLPVTDSDGKPLESVKLETQGFYGSRARISLPNTRGVDLGTWTMKNPDISWKHKQVEIITVSSDSSNKRVISRQYMHAPLISEKELKSFNDNFTTYLKNEGNAPSRLPFILGEPRSRSHPDVTFNVNSGQPTLHNEGGFYQFVKSDEETNPGSSAGAVDPEIKDILDTNLMDSQPGYYPQN